VKRRGLGGKGNSSSGGRRASGRGSRSDDGDDEDEEEGGSKKKRRRGGPPEGDDQKKQQQTVMMIGGGALFVVILLVLLMAGGGGGGGGHGGDEDTGGGKPVKRVDVDVAPLRELFAEAKKSYEQAHDLEGQAKVGKLEVAKSKLEEVNSRIERFRVGTPENARGETFDRMDELQQQINQMLTMTRKAILESK
jgi:hypothetical protein